MNENNQVARDALIRRAREGDREALKRLLRNTKFGMEFEHLMHLFGQSHLDSDAVFEELERLRSNGSLKEAIQKTGSSN